jgi:hypothetical protein
MGIFKYLRFGRKVGDSKVEPESILEQAIDFEIKMTSEQKSKITDAINRLNSFRSGKIQEIAMVRQLQELIPTLEQLETHQGKRPAGIIEIERLILMINEFDGKHGANFSTGGSARVGNQGLNTVLPNLRYLVEDPEWED